MWSSACLAQVAEFVGVEAEFAEAAEVDLHRLEAGVDDVGVAAAIDFGGTDLHRFRPVAFLVLELHRGDLSELAHPGDEHVLHPVEGDEEGAFGEEQHVAVLQRLRERTQRLAPGGVDVRDAPAELLLDLCDRKNPQCLIEVDGGVNVQNAPLLYEAGADVLVAGNAVFKSDDPKATIRAIKGIEN